ncbi:hypothetical protein [Caudoviricetes sp.]|nr:hypothetical protein [Caudoviricetes sp.]
MKFQVSIKDPDSLYDALNEAIELDLAKSGLSEDEQEMLKQSRYEKESEKCSKWVEYGEYYVIEFDTDAMTATVVPRK